MRKWAELISDVLVLIAKRIDVVEDYVAFGGVCKSWQVAAVKENFNERGWSHQIPWLMLAQEEEEEEEEERRFVSLRKGSMICKVMRLPEAKGKRCMESLGWFVTISQDGQLNLLHPFSRVQIGLPPVTTLKYYDPDGLISNLIGIQKAVLSLSRPSSMTKPHTHLSEYARLRVQSHNLQCKILKLNP
ncbi:hypothetical protein HYC85_022905 [Camellia sinensis]|uniref:KIB1-4 beta-propeller domain-containing protein n=1 Tax=Camellia sinensis TaxID=4442 RepID=A0A7J7GGZ2_CAMSI|nr:hypothetical protein HYC85_022905 [Camellia sinensis]